MKMTTIARTAACGLGLTMALSLRVAAQQGMNSFTIKGSFVGTTAPEKVYLAYDTVHYHPTDSAVVKDDKYVFHGTTNGVAHLFISKKWWDRRHNGWEYSVLPEDRVELFVERGTITVVSGADMQASAVTGSQVNLDYQEATTHQRLWIDTLRATLKIAKETKNEVLSQKVQMQVLTKLEPMMKIEYPAFIRQHPSSPINIYLLDQLSNMSVQVAGWTDSLSSLYQGLAENIRNTSDGKIYGRYITNELKTALGHKAPDFTQTDADGHPVSLSSFKGKYVFLDFWASWDNHATQSLAVLAKVYETYGSKGLVVFGVSLDKDKDAWQQVIKDANAQLTMQVSDLKGRENAAAQLYGITKLPRNLLIDPGGIIVAKDLTSRTIDKTLSSILE